MAKHFGMKFGIEHKGQVVWNCIGRLDASWHPITDPDDILCPISNHKLLYIHPDSLHLLNGIEGDLIEYNWQATFNGERGQTELDYLTKNADGLWVLGNSFAVTCSIHRIIQRNGKAFHYPEVERV